MFTTLTESLQFVKKQVLDQVSPKLKFYVASPYSEHREESRENLVHLKP